VQTLAYTERPPELFYCHVISCALAAEASGSACGRSRSIWSRSSIEDSFCSRTLSKKRVRLKQHMKLHIATTWVTLDISLLFVCDFILFMMRAKTCARQNSLDLIGLVVWEETSSPEQLVVVFRREKSNQCMRFNCAQTGCPERNSDRCIEWNCSCASPTPVLHY